MSCRKKKTKIAFHLNCFITGFILKSFWLLFVTIQIVKTMTIFAVQSVFFLKESRTTPALQGNVEKCSLKMLGGKFPFEVTCLIQMCLHNHILYMIFVLTIVALNISALKNSLLPQKDMIPKLHF